MSRAAGTHDVESAAPGYFERANPALLERIPATARRVVDVGCGTGALGVALKERGPVEVIGLEYVADVAAAAARVLDRVLRVDLDAVTALDIEPGSVDAIVCGDVLEHLRDPERVLGYLRPLLAPAGRLVCSVPNVKHWSVLVPLLVEDRFPYADHGLLDRTHVHFFTLEELDATLRRAGFDPLELGVTTIPLPDGAEPLVDAVRALGGDAEETRARLGAYQYQVVAQAATEAAA